jgi:DNA-binding MurR/RpiR family transcriptional regulator
MAIAAHQVAFPRAPGVAPPVPPGPPPGYGQSAETLVRIRTHLPTLRTAEQRVAAHILAAPTDALVASIGELARHSNTSPATVSKCCRALGYPSLAALRRSLAADLATTQPAWEQVLSSLDGLPAPALESCRSILLGIYNTFRILDHTAMAQAVERLIGARRVLLVGSGGSGVVAQFVAQKLLHRGIDASAATDPSACRDRVALATREDVVIAISHSGQTAYVVEVVAQARRRGVPSIAVTQRPGSPVTREADVCLLTSSEEPLWPGDSTRGRLATMALFDALYALMAAGPPAAEELPRRNRATAEWRATHAPGSGAERDDTHGRAGEDDDGRPA